ncbi:MAG: hypothetical protein HRU33_00555 [Rhodobacteraceae bacterium]|nr:hypothetical protein [Paracoccaceae bacterium]
MLNIRKYLRKTTIPILISFAVMYISPTYLNAQDTNNGLSASSHQVYKWAKDFRSLWKDIEKAQAWYGWFERSRHGIVLDKPEDVIDVTPPFYNSSPTSKELTKQANKISAHFNKVNFQFAPLPIAPSDFPITPKSTSIFLWDLQNQIIALDDAREQLKKLKKIPTELHKRIVSLRAFSKFFIPTTDDDWFLKLYKVYANFTRAELELIVIPTWSKTRSNVNRKIRLLEKEIRKRDLELSEIVGTQIKRSQNTLIVAELILAQTIKDQEELERVFGELSETIEQLDSHITLLKAEKKDLNRNISLRSEKLSDLAHQRSQAQKLMRAAQSDFNSAQRRIRGHFPYDCGGGAHHNDPFRMVDSAYICNTSKSTTARQEWPKDHDKKRRASRSISRYSQKISNLELEISRVESSIRASQTAIAGINFELKQTNTEVSTLKARWGIVEKQIRDESAFETAQYNYDNIFETISILKDNLNEL